MLDRKKGKKDNGKNKEISEVKREHPPRFVCLVCLND